MCHDDGSPLVAVWMERGKSVLILGCEPIAFLVGPTADPGNGLCLSFWAVDAELNGSHQMLMASPRCPEFEAGDEGFHLDAPFAFDPVLHPSSGLIGFTRIFPNCPFAASFNDPVMDRLFVHGEGRDQFDKGIVELSKNPDQFFQPLAERQGCQVLPRAFQDVKDVKAEFGMVLFLNECRLFRAGG